jgi:hypothetical protein
MAHQRGEPIITVAERPATGELAWYMRRMPPVIHEPIAWTHICKDITLKYRAIARLDVFITCTLVLGVVAVGREWVLLLMNPILAAGLITGKILNNNYVIFIGIIVWGVIFYGRLFRNYGHIVDAVRGELTGDDQHRDAMEAAAINEETWCREGAEAWTWRQRLNSLWQFTAAHSIPWWYGIGVLLIMQGVGGSVYMWVYVRAYRQTQSRHEALRRAAMVHYHHNKTAARPLTLTMLGLTVIGCLAIFLYL